MKVVFNFSHVTTFKRTTAVSSENRPNPCSTFARGRISSSISPFYKYFAPLEQEPIWQFD